MTGAWKWRARPPPTAATPTPRGPRHRRPFAAPSAPTWHAFRLRPPSFHSPCACSAAGSSSPTRSAPRQRYRGPRLSLPPHSRPPPHRGRAAPQGRTLLDVCKERIAAQGDAVHSVASDASVHVDGSPECRASLLAPVPLASALHEKCAARAEPLSPPTLPAAPLARRRRPAQALGELCPARGGRSAPQRAAKDVLHARLPEGDRAAGHIHALRHVQHQLDLPRAWSARRWTQWLRPYTLPTPPEAGVRGDLPQGPPNPRAHSGPRTHFCLLLLPAQVHVPTPQLEDAARPRTAGQGLTPLPEAGYVWRGVGGIVRQDD